MKQCQKCNETFKWNDDLIQADDGVYHKDCVTLAPIEWVIMDKDDPCNVIGTTGSEHGNLAFDVLDDGEYIDSDH